MIYLFLIILFSAFAESEIVLFNNNDGKYEFSKNYSQILSDSHFNYGDILSIGKYKFFYIKELGSGSSSKVYKVKVINPGHLDGAFALRIPLRDDYYDQAKTLLTREFTDLIRKGERDLKNSGIPIANIILQERETFFLHKLEESDFNLAVFLQKEKFVSKKVSIVRVQDALIEFSNRTYLFEKISDFHPGQLVYSIKSNKWTLLDWSESHKKIQSILSTDTIFDTHLFKTYLSYVYLETGEMLNVYGFPAVFKETAHMKKILDEIKSSINQKRVNSMDLFNSDSCKDMVNAI